MSAPYPLLEIPAGDVKNIFDSQSIYMTCIHNVFIQGANAMFYHAHRIRDNQVQDFIVFCLAFAGMLNLHHGLEEQVLFPELEKKMGEGALHRNVGQHEEFLPQFHDWEQYINAIKDGKQQYNADEFVKKIYSFSDTLVQHLSDEIQTIETQLLQKHITEAEMTRIHSACTQHSKKNTAFHTHLPWIIVCGNPATPWFPPFPAPMFWAIRLWFCRKYAAAWEFGPCDIYGKLKERTD